MTERWATRAALVAALGIALWGSGVVPAIVPGSVPAVNKQGSTGSKFQIAAGSTPTAGNCLTVDGNANLIDSGISNCGGAGTAVNSVAGLTGAVPGQGTDGKVLTAGTVSGLAATLCTDANGGATTSGCTTALNAAQPYVTDGINTYYVGPVVTPPVNANFSWFNQGSGSVAAGTNGDIFLTAPTTGSDNLILRELTATPATPYTVTVMLMPTWNGSSFPSCDLSLRETSSGKIVVFNAAANNSAAFVQVSKWTSATVFSAHYNSFQLPVTPVYWFRVNVTAGTLTWSRSVDGNNFVQIDSRAANDWFTTGPNKVGFALDNVAGSGLQSGCTLLSWLQN